MTTKTKLILMLSCFLIVISFSFLVTMSVVQAEDDNITFTPQVGIPGSDKFGPGQEDIRIEDDSIGQYIVAIYKYGVGIAGILAGVMIMIGGIVWLTAGGNPTKIGQAKGYIFGALFGLVLLLSSYMIFNTINPRLTDIGTIDIGKPIGGEKYYSPNCGWRDSNANNFEDGRHYYLASGRCEGEKPEGKNCQCSYVDTEAKERGGCCHKNKDWIEYGPGLEGIDMNDCIEHGVCTEDRCRDVPLWAQGDKYFCCKLSGEECPEYMWRCCSGQCANNKCK